MGWYSGIARALGDARRYFLDLANVPTPAERKAGAKKRRQRKARRGRAHERLERELVRREREEDRRERGAPPRRATRPRSRLPANIRRDQVTADGYVLLEGDSSNVDAANQRRAWRERAPAEDKFREYRDAGVPEELMALVWWADGRENPYVLYVRPNS